MGVALMTTLPFAIGSTDTVVYGCKNVCMSLVGMCVYEAMCSAVKISTVESPRDKASTDIVPPRVGRLSFPLSIGHLGKGQAEKLNQPMGERRESHIEV